MIMRRAMKKKWWAVRMKRYRPLIMVWLTSSNVIGDAFGRLRSVQALHPPDFIYQCQKTLNVIEKILNAIQHTSPQSTNNTVSHSRFHVVRFRRMKAEDLKWPLRKSETMQLIEDLERHKSTCTLALTENGLVGIHTVLDQTKLSNKCLAKLLAKQEKLCELNITREQGV